MAGHPLRPATYHCLGGPLPHQQANRTQGSPAAFLFIRLDMSPSDFIRFYQSFPSVIPDCRASSLRVTHPSALARLCKHSFAKDLHVLSILSAFILSQDQTLRSIFSYSSLCYLCFTPIYGCFLSFLYSVANVLSLSARIILTSFTYFVNRKLKNIFNFFINFIFNFIFQY